MTNEQAKNIIESCDGIMWNRLTDAENEALSMAIEALSAQSKQDDNPCENCQEFDCYGCEYKRC